MKMSTFNLKKILCAGLSIFTVVVFFTSCNKDDNMTTTPATAAYDVVYVETNDFNTNQNAVLAFKDLGNGKLEPLTGSPFLTMGSGNANPMQALGPQDSDFELKLSADKKFLLAVNSGSNTIAVFTISASGALSHVPGSPFASGGQTPVGIDVSDNFVFVVNNCQNPLQAITTVPNYTTFTIDGAGKLTEVAGAKFATTAKSSPSMPLVSRDKKYLFGADFLGFTLTPAVGTLRSFSIGATGALTAVAGSPYVLPIAGSSPDNGALGLWQHPSGSPLYVGLPAQGKVGVFAVNAATGGLTLQTTVAAGKAACWLRTNAAGNHLYVLNSGDNAVQVYNTASPLAPAVIQTLELKNSGPSYAGGGTTFKTSEDFSLHLSTNEKILYVVSQHTNTDFFVGNYNYLHALSIADDGKLTETLDPLQIPVPSTVRPKGSVVLSRQ